MDVAPHLVRKLLPLAGTTNKCKEAILTAAMESLPATQTMRKPRPGRKPWRKCWRGYGLIFAIAHPIFSIIGALVFLSLPKNQQPEPMAQAQRDYFAFGLCDGCGHPDSRICLCSICCPTVRWAANASSPKVNFFDYGGYGFWLSLLKMEVLICLPLILGTYRSLCICSLSVLVMYIRNRHKIRQVYGLPTWTCGSCMEDICCSMFCASIGLTIMQEALQLEYVGEPVALGKQVDGESASE